MQTATQLIEWVREARRRTCALVADLADEQMIGPRLATVNPLLWEIGHVAWFQEKWVLRRSPDYALVRADADALYDSSAVAHDSRWDLPLPDRDQTLRYMTEVSGRVAERLAHAEPSQEDVYFTLLSVFHEDMHVEAFMYTRQTLGYAAPRLSVPCPAHSVLSAEHSARDDYFVDIPGGVFELGATGDEPFVFDNEKWGHAVELGPFAIARVPVTQAEFAAFVDDGGYRQECFWSEEGRRWRAGAQARHPVYWQRQAGGRWLRRDFDRWLPLEPDRPMIHVNWHEADAYCRWSGSRLPTECEWEAAAAGTPAPSAAPGPARLGRDKRRFPWGAEMPTPRRANLDGGAMGAVDVDRLPAGDSAFGCRQMIGNVWEWTASPFLPYPGFVPDPYKEYSAPWFGTHKVLRGGCWASRGRLVRNTWRNFYQPDRRDVWAGFRICAQGA